MVKMGGKYGYMDKNGKMVIEPQFEEGFEFHEGIAIVKKDGKYGFIDKTGNFIIAPQFDDVRLYLED